MRPSAILKSARRQSGLTQRELARRASVAQSTVARIETGEIEPRLATLNRLLRHCGYELLLERRPGEGVDVTLIREMLRGTPRQRIENAASAGGAIARIARKR